MFRKLDDLRHVTRHLIENDMNHLVHVHTFMQSTRR